MTLLLSKKGIDSSSVSEHRNYRNLLESVTEAKDAAIGRTNTNLGNSQRLDYESLSTVDKRLRKAVKELHEAVEAARDAAPDRSRGLKVDPEKLKKWEEELAKIV
ncbi:MAG: hypothetical protein H0T55_06060 [Rubrobacteraceae bacterium]|nr:hypothetical protein [Rubrobacteraceae bacterium]